jgi:hypothetical protein
MRLKISRKEAKESVYWLKLVEPAESEEAERKFLISEGVAFMKIFGSIISKSGN